MIKKIRKLSDWLAYKIGNQYLKKYSIYYKGILVDLGCGEKPLENFFLHYADKYIGVDWSNTIHDFKADILSNLNEKIDIENEYADTVVSLSVMEHLCEPQIFLNETYRILKPNGYFILQVPFQWWIHEAPYDFFRYTPYSLKYMLEKSGFKNIKIEPQGGFFTTIVLKFNYFSIRMLNLPKPLWILWLIALIPIWTIGQIIAPLLDRLLDRDFNLETSGFFVVANK